MKVTCCNHDLWVVGRIDIGMAWRVASETIDTAMTSDGRLGKAFFGRKCSSGLALPAESHQVAVGPETHAFLTGRAGRLPSPGVENALGR